MSDHDRDARAGEYVIGTMPAGERAAFEREMETDPSLLALVRVWEVRLSALNDLTPEQNPDPQLWAAIERALDRFNERALSDTPPITPELFAPRPQPAHTPPRPPIDLAALRRSRAAWRATAIASGLIAAGLAFFLATGSLVRQPAETAPTYVAVVDRGGALPALVVQVDTAAGIVHIHALATEPPPPDRSLELWYIAASGGAPRSLGLVDRARMTAILPHPAAPTDLTGATLAVSLEPKGGSPTGGPTGQVVYSGKLIQE